MKNERGGSLPPLLSFYLPFPESCFQIVPMADGRDVLLLLALPREEGCIQTPDEAGLVVVW